MSKVIHAFHRKNLENTKIYNRKKLKKEKKGTVFAVWQIIQVTLSCVKLQFCCALKMLWYSSWALGPWMVEALRLANEQYSQVLWWNMYFPFANSYFSEANIAWGVSCSGTVVIRCLNLVLQKSSCPNLASWDYLHCGSLRAPPLSPVCFCCPLPLLGQ